MNRGAFWSVLIEETMPIGMYRNRGNGSQHRAANIVVWIVVVKNYGHFGGSKVSSTVPPLQCLQVESRP